MTSIVESGREVSEPAGGGGGLVDAPDENALIIQKHPESEFYKDEGGKSNALFMEVTAPPGSITEPIPLRFSLYYESGVRVAEGDQNIFNMQGEKFDPCVLTPVRPVVTVRFRLEKVSRRKDNQRFRVQVEPVQAPDALVQLRPALTRPICVLSKRKTGERMVAKRLGEDTVLVRSEVKDRSLGNAEFRNALRALCDQVSTLHKSMAAANMLLRDQRERLRHLERRVFPSAAAGDDDSDGGGGGGGGSVGGGDCSAGLDGEELFELLEGAAAGAGEPPASSRGTSPSGGGGRGGGDDDGGGGGGFAGGGGMGDIGGGGGGKRAREDDFHGGGAAGGGGGDGHQAAAAGDGQSLMAFAAAITDEHIVGRARRAKRARVEHARI